MFDQDILNAAARLAGGEEAAYRAGARSEMFDAPAPAQAVTASHDTESAALRAEFDRDPKIRDEFMCFEDFAAYRRAEAKGLFRILRRPAASAVV